MKFSCRLWCLLGKCDFPQEFSSTLLCDIFVCGVQSSVLSKKLLSKELSSLTFEMPIAHGEGWECACTECQMVEVNEVGSLWRVKQLMPEDKAKACHWCGSIHHLASSPACPARAAMCYYCGKTGHFQVVCKLRISTLHVAPMWTPVLHALGDKLNTLTAKPKNEVCNYSTTSVTMTQVQLRCMQTSIFEEIRTSFSDAKVFNVLVHIVLLLVLDYNQVLLYYLYYKFDYIVVASVLLLKIVLFNLWNASVFLLKVACSHVMHFIVTIFSCCVLLLLCVLLFLLGKEKGSISHYLRPPHHLWVLFMSLFSASPTCI